MATMKAVIEGLKIIAKYANPDDPCAVDAQHDEIFAMGDGRPMDAKDVKALKLLGWRFSDDVDAWRLGT